MICWIQTHRRKWQRVIKPVSVSRTRHANPVTTDDTRARHTRRYTRNTTSLIILPFHVVDCRLMEFTGFESWMLWHLRRGYRLSVDRYYWCSAWKIHPQGLFSYKVTFMCSDHRSLSLICQMFLFRFRLLWIRVNRFQNQTSVIILFAVTLTTPGITLTCQDASCHHRALEELWLHRCAS